jgi:uncharacterized protein (TIGR02145 family)
MKKNKILIYTLVIMGFVLFLTFSCKKNKDDNNTTATCSDGIQNQDETGVDCGGPCPACSSANTVTDIDGNVYNTVTIGTQVWMLENLKTTKYRNGDQIPNVTDQTQWDALTTGAYCSYNNDANNVSIYGRLYNFYAVTDSRNIAPTGWHVATKSDWTALSLYLGGDSDSGGKLKEAGMTHWNTPNSGATNSSGFTGLPGGQCSDNGFFSYISQRGLWWCSTQSSTTDAWVPNLAYDESYLSNNGYDKKYGLSVRCIKD